MDTAGCTHPHHHHILIDADQGDEARVRPSGSNEISYPGGA